MDCAGLLQAQGIRPLGGRRNSGHCGIQITANIYGHLATDLQWDAANKMDALLGTLNESSV
jgi:hypothetical protein